MMTYDTDRKQYRHDYNLGWRASQRATPYALDNADARGVSEAWYDGYYDYAADRPKFHSATCRTCVEYAH